LKIALVILHADPARGGAERYTVDLAEALRRGGHDASLVASSFAPGARHPSDVHVSAPGATRAGRYVRFLGALDRQLAEVRYDIVHAMLPVRQCDVYHPHAGIAAETLGSGHLKYEGPVERTLARMANGFNRRRRRFAAVERELLCGRQPLVVLCLSEYIKGIVRKHYTLPEEKLATLINAVDLSRFDPAARPDAGEQIRSRFGISQDKVVALMIAQDFARKGLRDAIGALARLDDPRMVLLVVGKEDTASYRQFARNAGVADRVIFAGPTDDPYAFYRGADLFVLPTRHDPCSLVVLEALVMGVPVVSTVFNGACEVMTDGVHGFVLKDPSDLAALSDAMRTLLDDGRRRDMSKACLALRPELSYEHHLRELLRVYADVTNSRKP